MDDILGIEVDGLENMLPACSSCNRYKSTFDLEMFRQMLSGIPKRLARDVSTYNIAKRFGMIEEHEEPIRFYFEKMQDRNEEKMTLDRKKDNSSGKEILFRAKRKGWQKADKTEWIYGYYFCLKHDDKRKHLHHFIIPLDAELTKGKAIDEIQVEIDPETLGQYINKKDRYDNPIFEKDIVEIFAEDEERFTVEWDFDTAGIGMSGNISIYVTFDNYSEREIEIIGNIFDNPELR